jgi:hypothetical protein
MFITIDETDRALARKAIELTEKKIESVQTALGELRLPTMQAESLAGFVGKVSKDIGNTERDEFEWNADLTRALGICCEVYHGKLESLRDAQLKLIVPIDDTTEKLSQLEELQDKLRGQGQLGLRNGVDSVTISTPGREPVTLTREPRSRV